MCALLRKHVVWKLMQVCFHFHCVMKFELYYYCTRMRLFSSFVNYKNIYIYILIQANNSFSFTLYLDSHIH